MEILINNAYNLDLLNLLNVLSGDPLYIRLYPDVYTEFGQVLSQDSNEVLKLVSAALGTTLVSPPIAFALSIIPGFDQKPLPDLLMDQEGFLAALQENAPRLLAQKDQLFLLFQVLATVIQELEHLGFREYWLEECFPLIDDRQSAIEDLLYHSRLEMEINSLVGQSQLPEEIHI